MANVSFSQFPSAANISESDTIVGLKSGNNSRFSFAVVLAWIGQQLSGIFVPKTRTINGKALTSNIALGASDIGAQATITANGILKGDGQGGVSAATPGTDYGTYSKPSGGIPSSDMASAVQTSLGKADTAYQKPSGGIPAGDLASGVIPTVPSASTANPQMDGTASPGSTGAWADGGHVHPRYTGAYAYDTIVSTVTDIHTDTTITLDKNYADYKLLAIMFNTRSADTSSYRFILTLSPLSIDLWGSYAIANREANGFVRIVPVSNQPKQIRFALTDLTALYVIEIRGIY